MNDFWAKSVVAAGSARILLAQGDADGAVSRAYYAMFDAARAALESLDADLAVAKTHATIIRHFGKHIVVDQGLDPSLGRLLNTAEVLRIAADYERKQIDIAEAKEILDGMEKFLSAVASLLEETDSGVP